MIDDLKKVKGVLDELMRNISGTGTGGVYGELIDSVMKWQASNTEEKNKVFSKNFCHELNIFIYMKDQEYF